MNVTKKSMTIFGLLCCLEFPLLFRQHVERSASLLLHLALHLRNLLLHLLTHFISTEFFALFQLRDPFPHQSRGHLVLGLIGPVRDLKIPQFVVELIDQGPKAGILGRDRRWSCLK